MVSKSCRLLSWESLSAHPELLKSGVTEGSTKTPFKLNVAVPRTVSIVGRFNDIISMHCPILHSWRIQREQTSMISFIPFSQRKNLIPFLQ